MTPAPQRRLVLLLTLALLGAGVILFDLAPFLRGGEVLAWQWQVIALEPPVWGRLALLAGVLALYIGVGQWLQRQRRSLPLLAWSMAGTALIALAVVQVRTPALFTELVHRALSPTATGPLATAGVLDWSDPIWRTWSAEMLDLHDFSRHVALSPPALPHAMHWLGMTLDRVPVLAHALSAPILYEQCANYTFLNSFTAGEWAAVWFGVLMPLWAGLGILPLYALARRGLNLDEKQARWLALAYALMPTLGLFAGSWNTLYPVLALASLWALVRSRQAETITGFGTWALFSGVLYGLLSFANFSLVPLALLAGWLSLLGYGRHGLGRALVQGVLYGIGALAVWGVYVLFTGDSPLAILQVAFDQHYDLDYSSPLWFIMHFWEWALFGGLPIVVLWLGQAFRAFHPAEAPVRLWAWALLLSFVILLLSQTARGETGRVWLFFAPIALLCAGAWLKHPQAGRALLIAQAGFVLALAPWRTMEALDMSPRPSAPSLSAEQQAQMTPIQADFGDFALLGWRGTLAQDAQGTPVLAVDLAWQAQAPMHQAYWLAALPVAPDGSTPVSALVWQADATRYPTTCWQVGETLHDRVSIPLTPESANQTGAWYISLSAFADLNAPLDTLTVTLSDGRQERQIGIGDILAP